MKDSIAHIVRVAARDGAATGPERLLAYLPSTSVDDAIADLDRAITAHVEAEVARRLAAAPEVEAAIGDLRANAHTHAVGALAMADVEECHAALLAAIAADKARAVEAAEDAAFIRGRDAVRKYPEGWGLVARPTPDEARRLVDAFVRAVSPARYDKDTALTARAALLRALGVEA